jgi:beta-barrel assembly-enhancing protease
MKYKSFLTFTLIFVFVTFSLSFALTYDEEKKYGKEIYREIIQVVPVNNDPYISLAADTIKKKLEDKAQMPFPVTLTIIDSESVDAFATMGGYVYITTGLIGMCDKEEELAGVVAHEFAHIKKRHIAKRMEKEKYINIGMLTTMLVGMLVGGGSTSEAIITSGMAGAQAMSLKYSREDEEEADREGSTIADKAGYGGLGSAMFLKKLRTGGGDKLLPQYLLTHPYHEARIVFLESMWEKNRVTIETPLFPYLALRAQILHKSARVGGDDIIVNRYLKDKADPVNNYAACLVYSLKGNGDESIRVAGESKSSYKNLFLGEMLINTRKFPEAVDVLKTGTEPVALFLLAKAYEGQSKNEMAISTLKGLLSYGSVFPEIYYRLGMLYGRTGAEAKGYDYLGRFYVETGKFPLAKTNLEKAVSRYGINSPEAKEVLQILDSIKNEKK